MTAYVIITHETGIVQRMLFATHRTDAQIDDHSAKRCGFQKCAGGWNREPTDAAVAAEIARTKYPAEFGSIASFAVVSEQDWHATPRHVETPRVRRVEKAAPVQVDLSPVLKRLEDLEGIIPQVKLLEKIIDAIEQKTSNVAEGRV